MKVMNVKGVRQQATMRKLIGKSERPYDAILELSNEFEISFGSVQNIFTADLGRREKSSSQDFRQLGIALR